MYIKINGDIINVIPEEIARGDMSSWIYNLWT